MEEQENLSSLFFGTAGGEKERETERAGPLFQLVLPDSKPLFQDSERNLGDEESTLTILFLVLYLSWTLRRNETPLNMTAIL